MTATLQDRVRGLTASQKRALDWLRQRGGSGTFDKNGVLLAAGETAPYMRSTWNALRGAGLLTFENPTGKGYGRATISQAGEALHV